MNTRNPRSKDEINPVVNIDDFMNLNMHCPLCDFSILLGAVGEPETAAKLNQATQIVNSHIETHLSNITETRSNADFSQIDIESSAPSSPGGEELNSDNSNNEYDRELLKSINSDTKADKQLLMRIDESYTYFKNVYGGKIEYSAYAKNSSQKASVLDKLPLKYIPKVIRLEYLKIIDSLASQNIYLISNIHVSNYLYYITNIIKVKDSFVPLPILECETVDFNRKYHDVMQALISKLNKSNCRVITITTNYNRRVMTEVSYSNVLHVSCKVNAINRAVISGIRLFSTFKKAKIDSKGNSLIRKCLDDFNIIALGDYMMAELENKRKISGFYFGEYISILLACQAMKLLDSPEATLIHAYFGVMSLMNTVCEHSPQNLFNQMLWRYYKHFSPGMILELSVILTPKLADCGLLANYGAELSLIVNSETLKATAALICYDYDPNEIDKEMNDYFAYITSLSTSTFNSETPFDEAIQDALRYHESTSAVLFNLYSRLISIPVSIRPLKVCDDAIAYASDTKRKEFRAVPFSTEVIANLSFQGRRNEEGFIQPLEADNEHYMTLQDPNSSIDWNEKSEQDDFTVMSSNDTPVDFQYMKESESFKHLSSNIGEAPISSIPRTFRDIEQITILKNSLEKNELKRSNRTNELLDVPNLQSMFNNAAIGISKL